MYKQPNHDCNEHITIQGGNVCVFDSERFETRKTPIGLVVITLENPQKNLGVFRILRSEIFDVSGKKIYDDRDIPFQFQYFSEEEVIQAIEKEYGYNGKIILEE